MSVPESIEEQLFRYYDGDLSEQECSEVRRMLAEAPEAEEALQRTERLGALLRASLGPVEEDALGEVPTEAIYRRIEERLRVGQEAAAGEAGAEAELSERRPRGVLHLVREGHAPWATVGMGAAVLAAAAAAMLVLWPARDAAEYGAPPLAHHMAPVLGSEVEEVDFGANAGTVFEVRGEAGQPLAVVWIEEEGEAP